MTLRAETPPPDLLAHRLARMLRHDVGDLLQSVYATVAILLDRVSKDQGVERQLLTALKGRAELCRVEIDAVVDYLAPMTRNRTRFDLNAVFVPAVAQARLRYSNLTFELDPSADLYVEADLSTLANAAFILLMGLGQVAIQSVRVRSHRDQEMVCCECECDGSWTEESYRKWVEHPFTHSDRSLFCLGLASMTRVVEFWDGDVTVVGRAQGGVRILVRFPTPR